MIIVFVLLFSGCAIQNLALDVYYGEILIEKTDLYYPKDFNVDEINNTDDIVDWMEDRIEYKTQCKIWKSNEQTLEDGYGDCKQFSIMFINLYYIKYGVETDLAFIDRSSRAIENGGAVNHAIVRLENDNLIEPQNGKIVSDSIGYIYEFSEIFY